MSFKVLLTKNKSIETRGPNGLISLAIFFDGSNNTKCWVLDSFQVKMSSVSQRRSRKYFSQSETIFVDSPKTQTCMSMLSNCVNFCHWPFLQTENTKTVISYRINICINLRQSLCQGHFRVFPVATFNTGVTVLAFLTRGENNCSLISYNTSK